ncbi:hypothetical protein OC834_007509, partial [Tilletia horrida]
EGIKQVISHAHGSIPADPLAGVATVTVNEQLDTADAVTELQDALADFKAERDVLIDHCFDSLSKLDGYKDYIIDIYRHITATIEASRQKVADSLDLAHSQNSQAEPNSPSLKRQSAIRRRGRGRAHRRQQVHIDSEAESEETELGYDGVQTYESKAGFQSLIGEKAATPAPAVNTDADAVAVAAFDATPAPRYYAGSISDCVPPSGSMMSISELTGKTEDVDMTDTSFCLADMAVKRNDPFNSFSVKFGDDVETGPAPRYYDALVDDCLEPSGSMMSLSELIPKTKDVDVAVKRLPSSSPVAVQLGEDAESGTETKAEAGDKMEFDRFLCRRVSNVSAPDSEKTYTEIDNKTEAPTAGAIKDVVSAPTTMIPPHQAQAGEEHNNPAAADIGNPFTAAALNAALARPIEPELDLTTPKPEPAQSAIVLTSAWVSAVIQRVVEEVEERQQQQQSTTPECPRRAYSSTRSPARFVPIKPHFFTPTHPAGQPQQHIDAQTLTLEWTVPDAERCNEYYDPESPAETRGMRWHTLLRMAEAEADARLTKPKPNRTAPSKTKKQRAANAAAMRAQFGEASLCTPCRPRFRRFQPIITEAAQAQSVQ